MGKLKFLPKLQKFPLYGLPLYGHSTVYLKNYERFFVPFNDLEMAIFEKNKFAIFLCQRNEKITYLAVKIEKKNIFTKSSINLIYFLLGSF